MSLRRYTTGVDGTIPVQALLYEDEDLLASQDGIGIYDGTEKSAPHQSGIIHATTHRLFYFDATRPWDRSFELDLSHVARTEHYAGLFTSSPKVTLHFHPIAPGTERADGWSASSTSATADPAFASWTCDVCNYRNPPGLSPAASRVCGLCGVPRSSTQASVPVMIPHPAKLTASSSPYHTSSSLPSSSSSLAQLTLSSGNTPNAEPANSEEIACVACTFLNHPALVACEMCGTPLPRSTAAPPSHPHAKSAPASRPTTPGVEVDTPQTRMIRLSFRKGGDKAFYAVLRRSLLGKGWEVKIARKGTPSKSDTVAPAGSAGFSGINGILRSVETTAATAQTDLEDSLKDLEALMVKWKDMVQLAQDLNERLTAASSVTSSSNSNATGTAAITSADGTQARAVEPEEATFIRSSLAQLGLQMTNAPVTLDMIRDERKWVDELARELAGVLQGRGGRGVGEGMMRARGIIGLDEVWGGWNRARGVALIPPSTFLTVLPQLPSYTDPPIHMRTFTSTGLSVLHTPQFTRAAFSTRLVGLLSLAGPKTAVDIAREEALPIGLTQEMVNEVEEEGDICRDEGGSGVDVTGARRDGWANEGSGEVRWWVNVFRAYVWDGQE
ncbi:hypothetical protein WOLCODRAFT_138126 [Wolfiporia cocos MD-104 SS10]|uniref:Vacuolar protein-sorting-associated protein 36 n=1 Tax=Wolfiporia cocos (strain MD-104) TaxID=742152 RepID=A0A2H3JL76_WOLCO|nr:hypothetical protein WOLCODRAFT_138126 [Wolfiporia cocos MD-104 SS10]